MMNDIVKRELTAFTNWPNRYKLTKDGILLWYILMETYITEGGNRIFHVSDENLQVSSGLSIRRIGIAREELLEMGLIRYEEFDGGGRYLWKSPRG